MNSKTVEHSKVCIGNLMQPQQSNTFGNIHGGEIIKMMDNAAGIVGRRHCRTNVVTARVDQVEFHHPVHIGNLITCIGKLTFVGRSSMEVLVTAYVEDLYKDEPAKVALTAFFTMVAVDKYGASVPVPSLELTTDEECNLFEEGRKRYLAYKKKREQERAAKR